ncbi:MAG: PilN domain-containing protein [Lachnospirales bacterium]
MKNINDINFLDSNQDKKKFKSAPIVYGAFALALLLLIGNYVLSVKNATKDLVAKTEAVQSEILDINSKIAEYELISTITDETNDENAVVTVDTYQDDINNLAYKMLYSYSLLDERVVSAIQEASIEGTFYSSYEVNENSFLIKGYAQNSNLVATLSYNLRNKDFVEEININFVTLVAETDTTKSLNYDLYEFEITGTLKGGA